MLAGGGDETVDGADAAPARDEDGMLDGAVESL